MFFFVFLALARGVAYREWEIYFDYTNIIIHFSTRLREYFTFWIMKRHYATMNEKNGAGIAKWEG